MNTNDLKKLINAHKQIKANNSNSKITILSKMEHEFALIKIEQFIKNCETTYSNESDPLSPSDLATLKNILNARLEYYNKEDRNHVPIAPNSINGIYKAIASSLQIKWQHPKSRGLKIKSFLDSLMEQEEDAATVLANYNLVDVIRKIERYKSDFIKKIFSYPNSLDKFFSSTVNSFSDLAKLIEILPSSKIISLLSETNYLLLYIDLSTKNLHITIKNLNKILARCNNKREIFELLSSNDRDIIFNYSPELKTLYESSIQFPNTNSNSAPTVLIDLVSSEEDLNAADEQNSDSEALTEIIHTLNNNLGTSKQEEKQAIDSMEIDDSNFNNLVINAAVNSNSTYDNVPDVYIPIDGLLVSTPKTIDESLLLNHEDFVFFIKNVHDSINTDSHFSLSNDTVNKSISLDSEDEALFEDNENKEPKSAPKSLSSFSLFQPAPSLQASDSSTSSLTSTQEFATPPAIISNPRSFVSQPNSQSLSNHTLPTLKRGADDDLSSSQRPTKIFKSDMNIDKQNDKFYQPVAKLVNKRANNPLMTADDIIKSAIYYNSQFQFLEAFQLIARAHKLIQKSHLGKNHDNYNDLIAVAIGTLLLLDNRNKTALAQETYRNFKNKKMLNAWLSCMLITAMHIVPEEFYKANNRNLTLLNHVEELYLNLHSSITPSYSPSVWR